MYTTYSQVPFYRKNWFAILTFFLLTPVFLLVLFTGPIYYQKKGELRTYGKGVRWAFAVLVGLAVVSAIVGTPKSTSAMVQQPSTMVTPAEAASSTTPPLAQQTGTVQPKKQEASGTQSTKQEAMAASRRDSAVPYAEQPAAQTYGPAIKGLQLGNDYETTSKVLANMQDDIGGGESVYTPTKSSSDDPLVFPHFDGGHWLVIAKNANTLDPTVSVHFDGSNNVDYYEISEAASDTLFSASNMSPEEFAQAIANNYNVSSLDPQLPNRRDYNALVPDLSNNNLHYVHEESNWRIDVHGKDVKVRAVQPQSQRFD